MSRRRYDIDTLTLPYKCGDFSCPCHATTHETPDDLEVRPVRQSLGWTVQILDDGIVIDELHGHTLNAALEDTHREYPHAAFNPESAG